MTQKRIVRRRPNQPQDDHAKHPLVDFPTGQSGPSCSKEARSFWTMPAKTGDRMTVPELIALYAQKAHQGTRQRPDAADQRDERA
jgi:hypothetical protein